MYSLTLYGFTANVAFSDYIYSKTTSYLKKYISGIRKVEIGRVNSNEEHQFDEGRMYGKRYMKACIKVIERNRNDVDPELLR